jgi:hypothetical protein
MAESSTPSNASTDAPGSPAEEASEPTFRDRLELVLFLAVEIICILLFVDFLFIGYYVK